MLAAIRVFDGDLRHITGSGQNKVRVVNPVLTAISHADDKRSERDSSQQVSNARFHQGKM